MTRRWEDEGRRAGPWPAVEREALRVAAHALAAAYPSVEAVYLFGSHARGDTHAGSDMDVAILAGEGPAAADTPSTAELARFLEERLGLPVDVVVVNHDLPLRLAFDVFRVETILFARDSSHAHHVACRYRAAYRDALPRLERGFERARARLAERANASHGS